MLGTFWDPTKLIKRHFKSDYMSTPDALTRLKTIVEVYEKELKETAVNAAPAYDGINIAAMATYYSQVITSSGKLIKAYREYTAELERLVPR